MPTGPSDHVRNRLPHGDTHGKDKKWFIDNIKAMPIPSEDKEAIFSGNFLRSLAKRHK